MNRKQLGILLVVTIALGVAGLGLYRKRNAAWESNDARLGRNLLGKFPINEITRIVIRHGPNEVTLAKKGELWRVHEREDYPANFPQISDFLRKAQELKIVQSESVGPSKLAQVDLAPPGQGSNSAEVVEFKGENDRPIKTLLLGKLHLSKSSGDSDFQSGGGAWPDERYVKLSDAEEVALIADALENIRPQPEQWLDKDFLKIDKAKSISVGFPEATNSWQVTRETEAGPWKLVGAKHDEELDSAKTAGLSAALSSPTFVDVMPGDRVGEAVANQPTLLTIHTFDGFEYLIKVGQKTNDDYPVVVSVSAQLPQGRTVGKDEKPEDKAKLDKEFTDNRTKREDKLKQEQMYEKWTYLVAGWTVDPLLKERSQLLIEKKKEESKTEGETSANAAEKSLASADAESSATLHMGPQTNSAPHSSP